MKIEDCKVGQRVQMPEFDDNPFERGVILEVQHETGMLLVQIDPQYIDHSGDDIGWADDGIREVHPQYVEPE